jgi:cell division protein FtsB
MSITTEEAELLARFHDISKELYSDNPEDSGLCAMHHSSAAALRSLAAERDALKAEVKKLRTALRGVLVYYNAPTPAEAKLKKAVLATPIEQARAALGEKE